MNPSDERLILVDGSSYLYRAFYALPALTTRTGEPTGAVLGVVNMLHKLFTGEAGERIAVVFDAPGRTFRDDLYADYKAHRPPMPEDLRAQREPLKEIIAALGVPLVEIDGVEADDVIGTLAAQASGPVVISTGDKDMAQLVDDRVTLLNTMSDTRLDVDGVEAKFGVPPSAIRDYLALVGDASDNIPGVPKVGPKTAAKWLQQYGDLDTLRANAEAIGGKVGESLRENLDNLALSAELATIRCDLALDIDLATLCRNAPDVGRLRGLYQRYEMRRLLAELDAAAGSAPNGEGPRSVSAAGSAAPPPTEYTVVRTAAQLEEWIAMLGESECFAVDLETDSLAYMDANIVGVAIALPPRSAEGVGEEAQAACRSAYIPVAHTGEGAAPQLALETVLARLRPLLEGASPLKVGQNLKYDMSVLARYGVELRGVGYDTMLESYLLDSTASRHDLDSLAAKYLGVETVSYEGLCGKGAKQIPFATVELEQAAHYAAQDADITLRLHRRLYPRLRAHEPLHRLFAELEMPLVPILSRIERHGVRVDAELLRQQSGELAGRMAQVEADAHRSAGEAFNLSSPRQIQALLFEQMGLPVVQRTPKGQPSTAEAVLDELSGRGYELPGLILEYRMLAKLKSTYTDKLPKLIHPRTGRVHTSYHQAVAATGRLSSSDPNLQNIPIRSAEGRRIRKAFIAEPGHCLLTADYSQVELRIMAHLSGDAGLCRAFAAGEDIHRATAAELFAVETVSDAQRRAAKAINFGLIYGMSAWGLARQLGIERDDAQAYITRYFERYPGVRAFMERLREQARRDGYVETLFGRRLYVPEIHSRNRQRREAAERTAINAPLQGTAADVIKRAMIAVDAWLRAAFPQARIVLQVHDELVLEVAHADADAVTERLAELMRDAAGAAMTVPLEVEIGRGENWQQAH